MPSITFIRVMAGATVTLCAACAANASQNAPVWEVGQEWQFLVKQYGYGGWRSSSSPRENDKKLVPRVQHEFHVKARVTQLMRRDGRECVCIEFTGGPDLPVVHSTNPPQDDVYRGLEYRLTLDRQTWSVVELTTNADSTAGNHLVEVDGSRAVFSESIFPVDWAIVRSDLANPAERTELRHFQPFGPTPDRAAPGRVLKRAVSCEKAGALRITVGDFYLTPGQEIPEATSEAREEVEQVWRPDELWWRSLRRLSGGLLQLEAILVSDPDGSGKAIEPPTPCPSEASTLSTGPTWTIGLEWRFLVKESGGDPSLPARVRFEYHMKARVAELTSDNGRQCARVEFTADDDAPDIYTAMFTLVVDAQTWSPVRFEYPKRHGGVRPAAEAGCYRALLPTMPGVPLDWVALRSDLSGTAAREEFFHFPGLKSVAMFGLQRAISAPQADGTLKVKVGLWVPRRDPHMQWLAPNDAMCEVEQVWHPGELWWRSFRRYEHGHLNLEATRVPEGAQP